ncbi:hypothetical protein [Paenibacillus sp. OAE614]|uniref:hypothetical protein n=1 Tax=Paenibacillus sp. OAE614 TaxID=2663804 RepID=UPI00178AC6C6
MMLVLYHYYEAARGPFRNLSCLPLEEAREILGQIAKEGKTFASKRAGDYMDIRLKLEGRVREAFIAKGGQPANPYPHYMTLGPCDWLCSWYVEPSVIQIGWDEFDDRSISFTYGDLFPTMRYDDGKPYRKQVYTKDEIREVIARYGLPQEWNKHGDRGPERYIEAQIWDEKVIGRYYPSDRGGI